MKFFDPFTDPDFYTVFFNYECCRVERIMGNPKWLDVKTVNGKRGHHRIRKKCKFNIGFFFFSGCGGDPVFL